MKQSLNLRPQCAPVPARAHIHTHRRTTRHTNCSAPRARNATRQSACVLSSRRACPHRPQAPALAQGLAAARSRKSAQHGTRSAGGIQGACMGSEAAHLLPLDANVELGAVRIQGVVRPPVAGLTMPGAHLRASVELTVSWSGRLGGRVGTKWVAGGSGLRAAPAHPNLRSSWFGW